MITLQYKWKLLGKYCCWNRIFFSFAFFFLPKWSSIICVIFFVCLFLSNKRKSVYNSPCSTNCALSGLRDKNLTNILSALQENKHCKYFREIEAWLQNRFISNRNKEEITGAPLLSVLWTEVIHRLFQLCSRFRAGYDKTQSNLGALTALETACVAVGRLSPWGTSSSTVAS